MNEVVAVSGVRAVGSTRVRVVVPALVADAGEGAARRFLEFFAATIRNKNTRMAYYRAVVRFFTWCERHRLGELAAIEPLHVAAYISPALPRVELLNPGAIGYGERKAHPSPTDTESS
jgi:hypothetical protein